MAFVTTKDGVNIYYKDWGPKEAQPIVFHHGWSADDRDNQMLFFLAEGYIVIATTAVVTGVRTVSAKGTIWIIMRLTRRPWLKALICTMRCTSATLPAVPWPAMLRSTASRRGALPKRCSWSAVPPLMVKTENNSRDTCRGFRRLS